MSDYESIMQDALDEIHYEKMKEEYVTEDAINEYNESNMITKVFELYDIPNLFGNAKALMTSTFEDEIKICKKLLEPVKSDEMPIIRQFEVFLNLIKLQFPVAEELYKKGKFKRYTIYNYSYFKIIECAYENKNKDFINLSINPMIPKKHYEEALKQIYSQSLMQTLQIPIENSTQYLQELFDIWILYSVYKKTSYDILKTRAYSETGKFEDKTQITRQLNRIKKLIK